MKAIVESTWNDNAAKFINELKEHYTEVEFLNAKRIKKLVDKWFIDDMEDVIEAALKSVWSGATEWGAYEKQTIQLATPMGDELTLYLTRTSENNRLVIAIMDDNDNPDAPYISIGMDGTRGYMVQTIVDTKVCTQQDVQSVHTYETTGPDDMDWFENQYTYLVRKNQIFSFAKSAMLKEAANRFEVVLNRSLDFTEQAAIAHYENEHPQEYQEFKNLINQLMQLD